MLLIPTLACGTPEEESDDGFGEARIEVGVDPEVVDFGTVALGEVAADDVTVVNEGDAEILLSTRVDPDAEVAADPLVSSSIAPGGALTVGVWWTSEAPATLTERVQLLFTSIDAPSETIDVRVTGTAAGPSIAVATTLDLGTVNVGCAGATTLTISNVGNEDLVLSGAEFTDATDVAVAGIDGGETIDAGESLELTVTLTPLSERTLDTVLQITSDDPMRPVLEVLVTGTGVVEEHGSVTFDVGVPTELTMLVAMNAVAAVGMFSTRWEEALPVFYETLQDLRSPFRIAYITETTGVVAGDVPYIDDTWSVDDAVSATLDMVESATGDNDYLFDTLLTAIEVNRDWLLDESSAWEDSRLNLVGINSDVEQSSGSSTYYVGEYLAYKEDPADIVIHGIMGDVPGGCSSAEPGAAFSDAATDTGGVFLSICAEDWESHLETLALAAVGDTQSFELGHSPLEWSIEVWIDGVAVSKGWSYNTDLNAIVFEDYAYPPTGAEVRVEFVIAPECAG